MDKQDTQSLKIQALLLKAQVERHQLKRTVEAVKYDLQPGRLGSSVVNAGSQAFADILPSAPSLFTLLRKYPGLSLGIAKRLLRISRTPNRVVRTLTLGLASWFIYHRFNKKPNDTYYS